MVEKKDVLGERHSISQGNQVSCSFVTCNKVKAKESLERVIAVKLYSFLHLQVDSLKGYHNQHFKGMKYENFF